jgi:hypothetical protein
VSFVLNSNLTPIIMSRDEAALIRLWREKRLKHRSAETVIWRFKPSG